MASKKKDKGGYFYHVTYFVVNRISQWRKWMRPETQKQQTTANSRIKRSAAEGVLKILEILACVAAPATQAIEIQSLSEVKIFQDWTFVVYML